MVITTEDCKAILALSAERVALGQPLQDEVGSPSSMEPAAWGAIVEAARVAWAADEDARMDLSVMADEMTQSLTWTRGGCRSWVSTFRDLSRLDEAALAQERSWSQGRMDAELVKSCLADARCQALHAGRRRWAQALALAGLLGSKDAEGQFQEAAAIGASWIVNSVAILPERFPNTRPMAKEIREAKAGAIQKTLESLLLLGDQLKVDKAEERVLAWLRAARESIQKRTFRACPMARCAHGWSHRPWAWWQTGRPLLFQEPGRGCEPRRLAIKRFPA